MIRRLMIMFLTVLLLFTMSSCFLYFVNTAGPIPYGVWKSEDPELTLDINPDVYPYNGIYVVDGEKIEVTIGGFSIYDFFEIWPLEGSGIDLTVYGNAYFNGTFKRKKDKIYYTLKPYWQDKTDYKTIVFEKIGDYDPPEN